ncbi:MAG: hypothetical protein DSY58_04040 [Desulfobulbus sp.]|nr:MAG: hypothetical protein DSY58_04040 [Desulfobulbus sp.]
MKHYLLVSMACFFLLAASGCVAPRYSKPVYRSTPVPAPVRKHTRRQTRKPFEQPATNRSVPQVGRQQLPRPANKAVANFSSQADRQMNQGKLKAAAQTLERGLRIAPKDALLWSKLARVRLLQRRYAQARSLATKSNSLARGNRALVRQNQQTIEQAR